MTKQNKKKSKPDKITKEIASLMIDKKALDVMLIDVRNITTLTDYLIICTSESDPQTRAIFNHIKDNLKFYYLERNLTFLCLLIIIIHGNTSLLRQ